MAFLIRTYDELSLRLTGMEKLAALHGDITVPWSQVRDVRVSPHPWEELRGMRSPGTGIPRVMALGTRRGDFGKDFVAVRGHGPVVVVDLQGSEFNRFVVTVPFAEQLASRLKGQ